MEGCEHKRNMTDLIPRAFGLHRWLESPFFTNAKDYYNKLDAHCVCDWSHTLYTDYLELMRLTCCPFGIQFKFSLRGCRFKNCWKCYHHLPCQASYSMEINFTLCSQRCFCTAHMAIQLGRAYSALLWIEKRVEKFHQQHIFWLPDRFITRLMLLKKEDQGPVLS